MKFNQIKNTINFRISFLVTISCFILIVFMVGRSIYTLKETEVQSAEENTLSTARDYAGRLKSELEEAILLTNTLANTFAVNTDSESETRLTRATANKILKNLLAQHNDLLGTWTLWEPNAFDGQDAKYANTELHDNTGRFIPYWIRNDKGELYAEAVTGYEEVGHGDFYLVPRKTKKETVFGPFEYNGVFMVSMISPILNDGKFYGIAAADISVDWLQTWVENTKLYGGYGKINVIAADGTIAASSSHKDWIGKNVKDVGKTEGFELRNTTQAHAYVENGMLMAYAPISIGSTDTAWLVSITVPISILTEGANLEMIKLIFGGLLLLVVIVSVIVYLLSKLIKPIKDISVVANHVAIGDLEYISVNTPTVEINQLNEAFEKVINSQRDITNVCTAIAQGDFTKKAIVKSEKDQLAKAVNQMIDNLKIAAIEDDRRNWTSEGLAKFAEILRADKNNVHLSESVVSNLVKYIGANQGAMFIYNDVDKNDEHLELIACYAYDRKKYVEKRISIGEGLVGQCFQEKQMLYLTDIPSDYVRITSGIGEATPTALLIVPLMVNQKVEGVIELASFEPFEKYVIEFLEKLAESIASTLSAVKINDRTKFLLEISQQQTEEMRAQEEEMRQNMEELQATQEEINRKESDFLNRIEVLEEELSRFRKSETLMMVA